MKMKGKKRFYRKGSLTVEAAFIMPVTLLLLLLLIYLGLYWYNMALCTAFCRDAARELAAGQQEKSLESRKKSLQKQLIGVEKLEAEQDAREQKAEVSVMAEMAFPFVQKTMVIYQKQRAGVLDQRGFILKSRSLLKGLTDAVGAAEEEKDAKPPI